MADHEHGGGLRSELVRALTELEPRFRTSTWTTPVGLPDHRRRLTEELSSGVRRYSESFDYAPADLEGYEAALRRLQETAHATVMDEAGQTLVSGHLARLSQEGASVRVRSQSFARARVDLDGLPAPELVQRAQQILATPKTLSELEPSHTADEAAELFRRALDNYGLRDWTIEVSPDMAARMSVNGPLRRVRIRKDTNLTRSACGRLLIHEIGGHVLRWVNSQTQPEPLAVLPIGRTVPTEEGLALWAERQYGVSDPELERTYAARVVGVALSQRHGIMEVAGALDDVIGRREAVEIAIRCKRGLRDPNEPGGVTKDWSYLGGLEMIQRIHDTDPTDILALGSVKWAADHLGIVRDLLALGRLIPPRVAIDPERLGVSV